MTFEINTTDVPFWIEYDQLSDTRTRGWFLVDTPTPVIFMILAYLFMVWSGPRFMQKRKPFKFKGLLIAYNFLTVLLNVHIVKDVYLGVGRIGYGYLCNRSTLDYRPDEMRIINAAWWFYISKSIEFVDTLFFILRKKTDQLSVLHVYHHTTMFFLCWTSVKWYPSGASARLVMLNSFVHVIMYLYYGLSACGPKVRKYLWWKKYLTSLQLVQFVLSLIFSVNSLVKGCNHHLWVDVTNILYMCSFLYLFGKFYVRKYTKKVKE